MRLGRLGRMWERMLPSRITVTAARMVATCQIPPEALGLIFLTVTSSGMDLINFSACVLDCAVRNTWRRRMWWVG